MPDEKEGQANIGDKAIYDDTKQRVLDLVEHVNYEQISEKNVCTQLLQITILCSCLSNETYRLPQNLNPIPKSVHGFGSKWFPHQIQYLSMQFSICGHMASQPDSLIAL